MKRLYLVINDNGGSVEDRVEYAFDTKEKADKYAEEQNKEWEGINNYYVVGTWLHD